MKLFRNKCAELLQENNRNYKPPTGNSSVSSLTAEGAHVSIDYAQVLVIVVRKTGASVTVIETTWVEGHGFISWVMITCPHSGNGMECIFSDPCNTASVAEQRVVKTVVFYLACKYNLEIVDANYGAATKMSRDCFLLREKYLLLKGHLEHLAKTSQEPVAMNPEVCEENVVATCDGSQILDSCSLPAVPAKRKKLLQLAYEKDLDVGSSDQVASGLLELGRMFDSSDPK
ncbi:uncharacterized protein LOC110731440 [Chenopodium quinoa]|uniref:uncharacterized protein LOC110731440 n=1 Tax=Chenopodium quinoa TaxID=63459 RepID=UPI000B76F839|nr:uncharacterized protein LOC110731440 [Chenopodium quinoa]